MKRPSLQDRSTKTNGFFDLFSTALWNALVDDADASKENLRQFYVTERSHQGAEAEIEHMLERIPPEFTTLYRKSRAANNVFETSDALRVGFYELDLIDFLLNIRSNRVLNVVGPVGVGKTTFLSYLFDEIRLNTESLKRFVPIRVSFTRYPQQTLAEEDLFQKVLQDTMTALQSEIKWRGAEIGTWFAGKRAQLEIFGSNMRRSPLVELIAALSEAFESDIHRFEPVFLFDNLDQLEGESVARVSTFARALFLETRLAIILAMRPPAFATHGETNTHKGAFHTFWIRLPPPDLRLYFCRRLSRVLRSDPFTIEVEGKPIVVRLPSAHKAIENIAHNVLTPENQRLVLEGISNNSIRKAGRAFLNILRYRDLRPELLFAAAGTETQRDLPGGHTERLLTGMMLGPSILYRDTNQDKPVVTNILHFCCNHFAPDYLIQYRMLALLDWAVQLIDRDLLVDWMGTLGYSRDHVALCLEHMLRRGLAYSPESEDKFTDVRHIGGSVSGQFYLTELCAHRQYLWHAIPDVPLEHVFLAARDEKKEFVGRYKSILEYLNTIAESEQRQMAHAAETEHAPTVLGAVECSKLLQRRIISAARRIASDAGYSSHESVRTAGAELSEGLNDAEPRTRELERRIDELLISGKYALPSFARRRSLSIPYEWAPQHRVNMRLPSALSAADPNVVDIECLISGSNGASILFGRLQSIGGPSAFDEMTELHPSGSTGVFRGRFSLPWSGEVCRLPALKLSLFADTKPILRKTFPSPR